MRVFIGQFTEQDLKNGLDKELIAIAQRKEELSRNGIKYIQSEFDKNHQIMKVWLTDKY